MSNIFRQDNRGPSLQQKARNDALYGDRVLRADVVPQLDTSVPARLRKAYDAVPDVAEWELADWLNRALRARAAAAHEASMQQYRDTHEGRSLATDDWPAYDAVIAGGMQPADFDYARHMRKLDVAERQVAAAERDAAREAKRQAARCRCCGALDVPTRVPAARLTDDAPHSIGQGPTPGKVVKLEGQGVVCAECESVIVSTYLADLAAQRLDKRRTRADAARDYLKHVTIPQR